MHTPHSVHVTPQTYDHNTATIQRTWNLTRKLRSVGRAAAKALGEARRLG